MAPLSTAATRGTAIIGTAVATVYAGFVAWSSVVLSYQAWIGLVVIPLLVLATVPMIFRAARHEPDPRFVRLLLAAFVLKGIATVFRYLMAFVLYDGVADASVYDTEGARLALAYREGVFDEEIGRKLVGTGFIRVVTGVLYAVTGQSVYVAYAFFSLLGFWGLYFLYRAFRVALPDGDARRYAVLVLFLPSMLFWPSSLGKEAWMTLGIGLVAYGSALLLSGDKRWVPPLLLGLASTALVRPHMTAALMVALAAAHLLGRSHRPATELTPLVRAVTIVVMAAGVFVAIGRAADFLGVEEVTVSSVDSAIDDTADRTQKGDSAFDSQKVNGVLDFPLAVVSVLFRPFPFEADNVQMMIAAAEGVVLMALGAQGWRRIRSAVGRIRRQPYLIFCLVYAGLFVYAFSNFSNFGLLTRERVQVLPFVLVLLALPVQAASTRSSARSGATHQGVPT